MSADRKVTEILITGYDGEDTVFAIDLTPGRAKTILMTEHVGGVSTVDSVFEVASPAFDPLLQILEGMGV